MTTCHTPKSHELGSYTVIHCAQEFKEAVKGIIDHNEVEFDGEAPGEDSFPVLGAFFVEPNMEWFYFEEVPASIAVDFAVAKHGIGLKEIIEELTT